MTALPSPSGSASGPQRPDSAHGSSRHSHRAADAPTGSDDGESGGPADGAWFAVVLRGYDRAQVEARLADLDRRIHDEIRRAEAAEQALSAARAQSRRLQQQVEAGTSEQAGFGMRVERVLEAAEREAAELRTRAADEAAALVARSREEAEALVTRAREEAEDRRTRTEEALLGRAATLDREFTARRAALDEQERDAARRERELTEREQEIDERLDRAAEEAERLLSTARGDAEEILSAARDEAAETLRTAHERRAGIAGDVGRLAVLRDEVRDELSRIRGSLSAELDREPVAAVPDDGLFGAVDPHREDATTLAPDDSDGTDGGDSGRGSGITALGGAGGASFVWSSGTGPDGLPPAIRTDRPIAEGSPETEASGSDTDDTDDTDDTATGTLLLGPGRRPGTEREGEGDTIGRVPPISLTSIGVLPFGELGAGRDNARTRTDGSPGGSRTYRGQTRGQGSGRRSR
ncbi:hypothetical protein [Pseudonocardia sp. NPDC049635]|uniref:hypothetical protein n=1 Tax=Pseudonocardia sp. NPDC049635 TaxID=3155506 RepID=UPI003408B4BE